MRINKGVLILALFRRRWKLIVLIHVQTTTKVSKDRLNVVSNETGQRRIDYPYAGLSMIFCAGKLTAVRRTCWLTWPYDNLKENVQNNVRGGNREGIEICTSLEKARRQSLKDKFRVVKLGAALATRKSRQEDRDTHQQGGWVDKPEKQRQNQKSPVAVPNRIQPNCRENYTHNRC